MPEHGLARLQTDRQGFDIMLPRRMLGERKAPSDDDSALVPLAAIEVHVDGCWNCCRSCRGSSKHSHVSLALPGILHLATDP